MGRTAAAGVGNAWYEARAFTNIYTSVCYKQRLPIHNQGLVDNVIKLYQLQLLGHRLVHGALRVWQGLPLYHKYALQRTKW